MISPLFWCHFNSNEDILLFCNAIVGPSCQHFGKAVNILPCNIHIAIYITTANIGLQSYISKFSQVKCSILSFYCTVLFTVCSAKKTLKNILHRERLRIDQETLQISVFASVFLSLVKQTALHFLFTLLSYVQGALQKRVWTTYFTEHV